jgi:anti-sigma B factor antagonist
MNTSFSWDRFHDDGQTVFVFKGELDMASAPEAADLLIAAIREGDVVLDTSELTFLESSGIAAIVEAYREAHDGIGQGRSIVLRNPSDAVRRVLEITGVDRFIQYDTN